MGISQQRQKVLDHFEARADDWSFGAFERAITAETGGNYQDAKLTIFLAKEQGRWPKTVKRYMQTLHAAFGNLPGELVKGT